jgi:hypothetical protein
MIPVEVGEACSLDEAEMQVRLDAWSSVARQAATLDDIDDGVRLRLPYDADLAEIARLAAAESNCCPIFEFRITLDGRGRAIEIRVPEGRAGTVHELLGSAL